MTPGGVARGRRSSVRGSSRRAAFELTSNPFEALCRQEASGRWVVQEGAFEG